MIGQPMIQSCERSALLSTNRRPMTICSWGRLALPSTTCRPMMIRSIRTLNRTKRSGCMPYSKGDPRLLVDRTTLCMDQTIPGSPTFLHCCRRYSCIIWPGAPAQRTKFGGDVGRSEAFSAGVISVRPQKIENSSTHHPSLSKYYMKSIPNFDSIGVASNGRGILAHPTGSVRGHNLASMDKEKVYVTKQMGSHVQCICITSKL